ncbi:MAG: galactose-1-phosphate uridylyltransferase [Deltaproteobacteria bacterium]|nr:MAG: galactose-1-phosphate uridylyltransferase [Deltaproteobacteria bacterium]
MPEMRKDPIVDRWVIIAPERAERPNAILRNRAEVDDEQGCPFCPGNERMTPPEVLSRRPPGSQPGGPGWTLRVVPNRYPALRTETVMSREGRGLFDLIAGVGAHEVIVETPEHRGTMADLPAEQIESVLRAWQERIVDLARDVRLKSIFAFKNQGVPAGATLSHAHSQLIALPVVPPGMQEELRGAKRHFGEKERCVFCDIVGQELRDKERLVHESERMVVLSPWAARTPFETWIVPREHRSSFESSSGQELHAAADALRALLRKIDVALEKPAFNLYLHTMPLRENNNDWYHWHLELKPMLQQHAGFEWASGCTINPTPPEEAAAFLRQTEV